ncbi:hypothetical protein [Pseudomonas sp. F(2018)]|uniref:hypothetical protein n=1 Tax=Pseudomonas sp. F(2018) TaxID=2502240 RepID=UPI0010F66675|nr:hypothetical protein [Pseudomonas sp. F(2018)]
MKPTEKAALIAIAVGIAAGVGLAFLLEGASVWLYVGAGVIVAGAGYSQIVKQMAEERIADGDFAPKEKI